MSFLGGAAITGGLGLINGLFQGIGAKKRQEEALKWQQNENKLAREWQEKTMQYQNEWNKQAVQQAQNWQEKMVASQRSYDARYNSPTSQMARIQAAGLNPDLMYGSGVGSMTATSSTGGSVSPIPSAGAGDYNVTDGASVIMNTPTIGESMLQGLSASKIAADIANVDADTQKKKGEATSIDYDNLIKSATTGSKIELENFQVTLAKQAANLNEKEISLLSQKLNNLKTENDLCNQQIQESISKVSNMDSVTLNNRISAYLASPRFELEVKRFEQELKQSDASINLSNAEAKKILVLLTAEKLNLDTQAMLNKAHVGNVNTKTTNMLYERKVLDVHGKQLHFDYEQNLHYNDAERIVNMVGTGLNSVSNIISNVYAPTKIAKGFGSGKK